MIVSICFISRLNHSYCELNECLNITICKYLVSNSTNISNFHPLEVAGRGSETQLQVAENLNKLTWLQKGEPLESWCHKSDISLFSLIC